MGEYIDPCLYFTCFAGSEDYEDQVCLAAVVNSRPDQTDPRTPG